MDPVPPEFAICLQRRAVRRGFDGAQRQVIVCDGANWIWSLAIQIVNFFHAAERLWDVARTCSPTTAPAASN